MGLNVGFNVGLVVVGLGVVGFSEGADVGNGMHIASIV